jgi:hypothetical protein
MQTKVINPSTIAYFILFPTNCFLDDTYVLWFYKTEGCKGKSIIQNIIAFICFALDIHLLEH